MSWHELDSVKKAIDGSLGVGAITSPFWAQILERGGQIALLVGGVWLVALRIRIARQELAKRRAEAETLSDRGNG